MLSGKEGIPQPSPPLAHAEGLQTAEPDGRREADLCEPVQNSLHETVKSARTGPSEGSHEHTCESKIYEIGKLEQGVLDLQLQRSPCSPEQRPILHTSESLSHSSGVDEEEDRRGISKTDLEISSKDTPRDVGSGDVLHEQLQATQETENPGPHQSLPSSQPVTPSALPLHLIPLLPQASPSPKRQRRSIGLSSNQTDNFADDFSGRGGLPDATAGSTPSPHRRRLPNFSAESAGISRTLAYAMDQMNDTPLGGAELEELAVTREAEVDCEGDGATRPKIVRFEESTRQPVELAERLWAEAVQAAATARMQEESEPEMGRETQSGKRGEENTCGRDHATTGGKNTAGEEVELPQEELDMSYVYYKSGMITLEQFKEAQKQKQDRESWDATLEKDANAWFTAEGGSRTVNSDSEVEDTGSEAERATLASQIEALNLNPAQVQEYTRLKLREVELRHAEAEARILEGRLEVKEKDLRIRLATVKQRLEAVRQRKASIICREEIIRKKLEAIAKEAQGSDNALGTDATPESS